MVNCCVTCLSLILDVRQYDSGIGKGKSLAFEPKFRAKLKIILKFIIQLVEQLALGLALKPNLLAKTE